MNQTVEHVHGNCTDAEYTGFLASFNRRFGQQVAGEQPLFTTDAQGLWATYLDSFEPEQRQHHNCNACRHFVERFGGLVTLKDGKRESLWHEEDAPDLYRPAFRALARLVTKAKVDGVFLSSEPVWGQPVTGIWHHLALTPPNGMLFNRLVLTAGQAMAEKREDFKNVMHALNEFTQPMVEQAVALLQTDSLYRSEKVQGQAQWLHDLHVARAAAHGEGRAEAVWMAVAKAPAGFCHPRSSMIGSLLEDIASGMDFSAVARRFAAKMHPLQYQRPQAAPAAGNIAKAEALFAQIGLAPALERRVARIDEIPKVWEPEPQQPTRAPGDGVFGHVTPKGAAPAASSIEIPAITITLEKFVRTVIPTAEALDVLLGSRITGIVITTAVNADAPKLFQWDHPFSHYVWHGGSTPAQFGLSTGWAKVAAITRLPARWNDDANVYEHRGDGIILLLDGARESREAGNALFPEQMRGELHGVRSTIEAYSRGAKMNGLAEGSAVGIDLRKSQASSYPTTVRVTASGRTQAYKIDRWD